MAAGQGQQGKDGLPSYSPPGFTSWQFPSVEKAARKSVPALPLNGPTKKKENKNKNQDEYLKLRTQVSKAKLKVSQLEGIYDVIQGQKGTKLYNETMAEETKAALEKANADVKDAEKALEEFIIEHEDEEWIKTPLKRVKEEKEEKEEEVVPRSIGRLRPETITTSAVLGKNWGKGRKTRRRRSRRRPSKRTRKH